MIIFVRYWNFILCNYDYGGGGDDDDNICDLSVFILMICRNQKMFWEKTRFDETAAAFEVQKKMVLFHGYIQSGFLSFSYECLHRVYVGKRD